MPSALVVALLIPCICFGAGPALAAGFHGCATQKLENKGVFGLRAGHAKCRLARQVAFARARGDETPKGFSCITGTGGNLTPFRCTRRDQAVRFSLEG